MGRGSIGPHEEKLQLLQAHAGSYTGAHAHLVALS